MPFYQFAIASGWNAALGSLANVETTFPKAGIEGYGSYDPGAIRIRADGTQYLAGYAALHWRFSAMTRPELRTAMTTYCNTSYSGKVTSYTLTDNSGTYSRLNAILTLPKLPELDKANSYMTGIIWRFTRLTTAS